MRASIAQAAQDVAALVAVAGTVEEQRTTLDPYTAGVPDPALLALIEGPAGRYGLVVLDPQVVAALIEIQTTGRVVPHPAETRAPTRTDAIMCADFIDRMLEIVEERVAEAELDIAPALAGFRYALALAEPRAIAMTLEDTPYRLFGCEVDLGRGAKSGRMQVLLPFDPPGQGRRAKVDLGEFNDAIRAQVFEVEARLTATLLRRTMALSEVMALDIGALIPVPHAALSQVAVEALDGTVVARGRLGQVQGNRAVRLTDDAGRGEGGPALSELAGATLARPAAPRPAPALPAAGRRMPAPAAIGGLGDLGDLGVPGEIGAAAPGEIDGLPDLADLASLGTTID
ncbi:MAG: FliM/FliN family flagellar motor switch protein [Maritimibacter sp.]|nr:FliM/FliN family flagellar motor switch protein [Maritimibacter sp.]